MTNDEYRKLAEKQQPGSKPCRNMLRAFWVGGAICCAGQLFMNLFMSAGQSSADAGSWCCIALIFSGAVLTGLGIYDKFAKYAGAGTLVPITGFANSVVSPALEFKTEGLVTGTAAKMFIIAGPVIVYGVGASAVYGLILCIFGG